MARHFFPPDHDNAFLQELKKPTTLADGLFGYGFLFGPLVAGAGVPALVVIISGRDNFWLLPAILGLVVGLYVLVWGALFHRLGQTPPVAPQARLGAVPFGDAASRGDGELVMLEGRVAATQRGTVASALTGKRVLWSKITLTTYQLGNRGYVPEETRELEQVVPFTVDDGGTAVEVDARGGVLRAAPHQTEARLDGPGGPRVRRLLEREKLVAKHGKAEATEWALCAGDRVVVLGVVRRSRDAYRGGRVEMGSGPHDLLAVSGESREELVREFDRAPKPSLAGVIIGAGVTAFGVYALVRMVLEP